MTSIRELWSPEDAACEQRLLAALADDDLAGVLLAIAGTRDDEVALVRAELSEWGASVRARLADLDSLAALTYVMRDQLNITGDDEDYYNPINSSLASVVTRRKGLPILVSCLWILVGREAGIDVEGVGLPGHFITRVAGELVDTFQGGTVLSLEQCQRIVDNVGREEWDDRWLDPTPVAAIAHRVLMNLVNSHRRADDKMALYRTLRLLARLSPDDANVLSNLAHLTEEFGAYRLAVKLYQDIANRFDGTRQAQIAAIRLVELGSRTRTLN